MFTYINNGQHEKLINLDKVFFIDKQLYSIVFICDNQTRMVAQYRNTSERDKEFERIERLLTGENYK